MYVCRAFCKLNEDEQNEVIEYAKNWKPSWSPDPTESLQVIILQENTTQKSKSLKGNMKIVGTL